MQRVVSSSWTVRVGFNMDVDFCVWLLEWDGLRVPPFDCHPGGTGELRGMGMTAESWNAWFCAIAELPGFLSDPYNLYPAGDPMLLPGQHPGDNPLGRRLCELWESYGPLSNKRRHIEPTPLSPNWKHYLKPNLCQVLTPYHEAIPAPFVVHNVRYAAQVDALLPPSTAVLSFNDLPGPDAYRRAIARAAASLMEAR